MSSKTTKSTKPKVQKTKSPKLDDTDFSPDLEDDQKQNKKVGRNGVNNKNEIIKSRVQLIIDLLSGDDDNSEQVDERALRRNVNISLKHLKEVVQLL